LERFRVSPDPCVYVNSDNFFIGGVVQISAIRPDAWAAAVARRALIFPTFIRRLTMDFTVGAFSPEKGVKDRRWAILGQTYVPLHVTEHSASLHAVMPPGAFVPTHTHLGQDEMLFLVEGELEFHLNGEVFIAGPGNQVTLPKDVPHAFYNKSGKDAVVLVTVSPPGQFFSLMESIDGVLNPAEVARLGGEHNVPFI
jgi:quercetin dioxygenase-like cupin family protein